MGMVILRAWNDPLNLMSAIIVLEIYTQARLHLPFQNFKWCWMLLGTLEITLGGLILVRRWSTFAAFVPQYQLCPLCFESNQRPTNCLTTPRKMQCVELKAIPVTMSKLGSPNKGLGALNPNTFHYVPAVSSQYPLLGLVASPWWV